MLSRFLLLLFPLISVFADVGRFIEPISISRETLEKSEYIQSSALVRSGHNFDVSTVQYAESSKIVLDRQLIEGKLGLELSHRYQASGKISVFLTREWNDISIGANFLVKIEDCMPDQLSPSTFVRFSVWDQGSLVGKFAEPIRMAHFVEVFFSNSHIGRGSRLNASMFTTKPVDVLKQYAGAVPSLTKLDAYQLSSSLKPNSAIRWNNLSKVTLVRKGKVVDVFASGNGIYVTMKGMAMEDGVEGGLVKVRNLSSDKIFHAKVLNENSVKVRL